MSWHAAAGVRRHHHIVITSAIAKGVKDLIAWALGGLSYGKLLANIASVFILGPGIIAALNQIGVATTVTTPP